MPTSVGPNTFGEENLVFGYDLGDRNSFPGIPAVNCARVPTTSGQGNGTGNWSVTEITDGSITPPRKGARVFKFVAGTTSNLYRQANYYAGGGFSANNPQNPLILGKTSPSNFTTVSEPNKYRWGFWVRGVETNNAGWGFYIDIGDLGGGASASYTVGNNTEWYFISCVGNGTNSNGYPYDFFDMFSSNQGLTMYIADMGIMRSPGTVDNLPILQAYPQWVDYGQERSYTTGLKDLTGNSTIDLTNVSFDSNAQMVFDGTNDRMYSSQTFNLSNNFTFEFVMKPSTLYDYGDPLGASLTDTGDQGMSFVTYADGHMAFNLGNGAGSWSGTAINTSAGYLTTGVYYHITGVCDAGSLKLYKNGVLTHTGSTPYTFTNYSINIGNRTRTSTFYPFNGSVDMVKAYNRALTASEIRSNFNAIKGRFNI